MGILDSLKDKLGGKDEEKSGGDRALRKPTRKPGEEKRSGRMPEKRGNDTGRRKQETARSTGKRGKTSFEKSERDKMPIGGERESRPPRKSPGGSGGISKERGDRRTGQKSPSRSKEGGRPGNPSGGFDSARQDNPLTPKTGSGRDRGKARSGSREPGRKPGQGSSNPMQDDDRIETLLDQNDEMISLLREIRDRL